MTLLKGRKNESIAMEYLSDKKYIIYDTNLKITKVEIDIIAQKENKNEIYFYEVKTVKKNNFLNGYFPFSYRQWKRYLKALQWAQGFLFPEYNLFIGLIVLDEYEKVLFFEPRFQYYNNE